MDGRGCLAKPLTQSRPWDREEFAVAVERPRIREGVRVRNTAKRASRITRSVRRWFAAVERLQSARFVGVPAALAFVLASICYGVVKGDHVPMIVGVLEDTRDAVANAAGFRIASVSLAGPKQVSRAEIFRAAGVTDHASLMFLDAEAARERVKAIPWIADASIRKLYPDRLQITVSEREAFALWQINGKVSVIAADGTVLGPLDPRFAALPFVVGRGAAARAKEFLALLDHYPGLRDQMRAAILVAERRWNLLLKNGIDIRLPETGIDAALATLVELDHDKGLLTRDIAGVDLRLPDRVSVQLSDAAAGAREDAAKDKKTKRKGGDA